MSAGAARQYVVRPPLAEDVAELSRIHVLIWQQAYRGLLPQEYLDAMDPTSREARWHETVARVQDGSSARTGQAVLVAESRGSAAPVGFIHVGPPRDEDSPRPTELMVLNLLAAHHGTGVAQALVAGALGDRPAYLWVLQGNERAIAFYRKLGFELDGVTKRDDHLACTDLRMVR